jgi:hypothetical protein
MTAPLGGGIIDCMRHFVNDDAAYLDWLAEHPTGFVINTGRNPSAAYLMLHRASCGTISGVPARGATFTGDYTKVCGSRDELEAFASQLGGAAHACGLCLAQPARRGLRGPGSGKYDPLRDHLARQGGGEVKMTFAAVEELVGRLPDSARLHRAWWANGTNVEAQAWRDAGWRVESVDQAAEEVVFARGATGGGQRDRHLLTGRPGPYIDAEVTASLAARAGALRLDTAKLVRLIGELNDNYSRGNAYAAHALLRAILDHIPPMLGCSDFPAVVSNYRWSRADRGYVRKLSDFRLQANDVLHRQMSRNTDLLGLDDMPPRIWVNRLLQECASSQ